MKIESVNVTVFQYPTRRVSDSAGHSHPGAESMAKMAMLTITADDGAQGFSFAPPEVVRPFVVNTFFRKVLVGQDPFNRERIWQDLNHWQRGSAHQLTERALSFVEQALWDLIGRSLKMPVYKLLGGYRDTVPAYGSTMCGDDLPGGLSTPEEYAAFAEKLVARGYKAILTMPETMSVERRNLLKAYGAKIVLTDGSKGMKGAIAKAEELAKETPNSFIPEQFANPANPAAHEATTGPEIYNDLDGKVDAFIAGVGTGGTLSGVGHYLKKQDKGIHVVAVEPETSPVLSKGQAGPHKIQGIGAGFVPETLDTKVYDEVIAISNDDAFKYGRQFSHVEGVLIGISSGAALAAAIELAKRPEFEGKNIVALLPDTGDRYLSTELFAE